MSENSITIKQIRLEAYNARYYSYERRRWEGVGWVEWMCRSILNAMFPCMIESLETACSHRSWKSISKMPNIPKKIKKCIEDIFLDSRTHTNPLSSDSKIISKIYCRILWEIGKNNGEPLNCIHIKQRPITHAFNIFNNRKFLFSVPSSGLGDFYNKKKRKKIKNSYDALYNKYGKRIAAIRLSEDYSGLFYLNSCMEIFSGKERPLARVQTDRSKKSFVFREANTNRLLAVGILNSRAPGKINWSITIINHAYMKEKKIKSIFFAWALLKHSQRNHLPNPFYRNRC